MGCIGQAALALFTVGSVLIYVGTTLLQEDSERALAILILGCIGECVFNSGCSVLTPPVVVCSVYSRIVRHCPAVWFIPSMAWI